MIRSFIFTLVTIITIIALFTQPSIFLIENVIDQGDISAENNNFIKNKIQNSLHENLINNLQQFEESNIIEIENGYSLIGIGIEIKFTDKIEFNVGSEHVIMDFEDALSLHPEYSQNIEGIIIPGNEYVIYNNIYEGIDLVFSVSDGILKSNYIVRTDNNLSKLKISYYREDTEKYKLSNDNENLNVEDLWIEKNLVIKTISNTPVNNKIKFNIVNNYYTFITDYTVVPFIIDPDYSFLNFGTFLGGTDYDQGNSIAIDTSDYIYITGTTYSTDFPTLNANQTTNGGGADAFISSFYPNGSLRWSTFLGGSGDDLGYEITVDTNSNVYITGETVSTDFPFLNATQPTNGGGADAFISSFTSNGLLRWSTFLGGSGDDFGKSISIDSYNNIYISGTTVSTDFSFLNAYQISLKGGADAFISSFTSNGLLRWSTFLGGSGDDFGNSIAFGSDNNVYVTGTTNSYGFPTLNANQTTYRGGVDAFISSFTSNGLLRWSTFLGGSGFDFGNSIVFGSDNNVYVTGTTYSSDFPTLNAYQISLKGGADAFISSFTSNGLLRWSTFLGGSGDDIGNSIAFGSDNNVYVTGTTLSNNFPTLNSYKSSFEGNKDVFVSIYSPEGNFLESTYLGGVGDDSVQSIVVSDNSFYVIGRTSSINFPLLNAYQNSLSDAHDIFISNILNANKDFDKDGMSNIYEYLNGLNIRIDDAMEDKDGDGMPNLYEYQNGFLASINDAKEDKDGDGMPNLYEYQNGLLAGTNDAMEDKDGDGMPNLYEYQNGLLVRIDDAKEDKDGDGMPNLYEYQNGLLVSINDAKEDKDGDGMPNLYEYQNGLLAGTNDAMEDIDGDGMPNLYEYQNGLLVGTNDAMEDLDGDGMPNIYEYQNGLLVGTDDAMEDLDGDGMPNLYEYQNGLLVGTDDAMEDLDGDGLSNLKEYELGTKPDQNNTLFVFIGIVILILGILIIWKIRKLIKKLKTNLKKRGINNIFDWIHLKISGFHTKKELEHAKSHGFKKKKHVEHAFKMGFTDIEEFVKATKAGFKSKSEINEIAISTNKQLINIRIQIDEFRTTISKLMNELSLSTLELGNNPSKVEIEKLFKYTNTRIADVGKQISTITMPDDEISEFSYELSVQFKSVKKELQILKNNHRELLQELRVKIAEMHEQALKYKRTTKLYNIVDILSDTKDHINRLKYSLSERSEALDTFNTQLNELSFDEEVDTIFIDIKEKIMELDEPISSVSIPENDINNFIDELTNAYNSIKEDIQILKENNNSLQKKMELKITEIHEQIQQQKNTITLSNTINQLSNMRNHITILKQSILERSEALDTFNPQLNELPLEEEVDALFLDIKGKIIELDEPISSLYIPDDELNSLPDELMEKYNLFKNEILALKENRSNLQKKLDLKINEIQEQALKQRRTYNLNRMLKRITSMHINEFAEKLEYEDIEMLKKWLIYEMSDDIPLKLDMDIIKMDTNTTIDIENAIDDMLNQFDKAEKSKKGKI